MIILLFRCDIELTQSPAYNSVVIQKDQSGTTSKIDDSQTYESIICTEPPPSEPSKLTQDFPSLYDIPHTS